MKNAKMTPLEAKAILEENAVPTFPPKVRWSDWVDAMTLAAEALERQEKYKWHDLRVDPNDLPEINGNDESEYVLVMIGCPEWNHWEQAYYSHAKKLWSTYEQNIFAWRYIESFAP